MTEVEWNKAMISARKHLPSKIDVTRSTTGDRLPKTLTVRFGHLVHRLWNTGSVLFLIDTAFSLWMEHFRSFVGMAQVDGTHTLHTLEGSASPFAVCASQIKVPSTCDFVRFILHHVVVFSLLPSSAGADKDKVTKIEVQILNGNGKVRHTPGRSVCTHRLHEDRGCKLFGQQYLCWGRCLLSVKVDEQPRFVWRFQEIFLGAR